MNLITCIAMPAISLEEKNRMFIYMLRRLYCVANISEFHPEHIGRHIK